MSRPKSRARSLIRVAGVAFVIAGLAVVGYLGYELWWKDARVATTQTAVADALENTFASPSSTRSARATPGADQPFAVVRIPRFGSDYARPVYQGVDADELAKGIGHVPESAMPGQIGNFGSAGHRVTFGKPYNRIHEMQPGDPIIVETAAGTYTYRYVRFRVTTPEQVEVLAPVPDQIGAEPTEAWMTLIACHPQFSARERYVGYAKLDHTTLREPVATPTPSNTSGSPTATTSSS